MKIRVTRVLLLAMLLLAFTLSPSASAQFYAQTNLVSDPTGAQAMIIDGHLINPWGMSHSARGPFWVSDAGTNLATIYSVDGTTGAVSIVPSPIGIPAAPTGQVFNGSSDFVVSQGSASGPAAFIFAGLDGKIYGWNPNVPTPVPPSTTSTSATLATTGAPPPAVYTGLAFGLRSGIQFLYAANNAGNRIDVWDSSFTQATLPGNFVDPSLPAGLAPFNIANINGDLYVSYAPANPPAVGTGVINVFDTDGNFEKRFATGGTLLDPWGMVVAPPDFGQFANALLVGNFNLGNPTLGQGNISAFSLASGADNGKFLGLLKGTDGNALSIDGLWTLIFGNDGAGGNSSVLYFSAGIQGQGHGLFGSLSTCHEPVISGVSANPNALWPPNNQFVPVTIGYSVTDGCDDAPACTLNVTAADSGGGINDIAGSSTVIDAHTVELLASRNGGGDGRVYTVEVACKDKLPLSSSAKVTITVPLDQAH